MKVICNNIVLFFFIKSRYKLVTSFVLHKAILREKSHMKRTEKCSIGIPTPGGWTTLKGSQSVALGGVDSFRSPMFSCGHLSGLTLRELRNAMIMTGCYYIETVPIHKVI